MLEIVAFAIAGFLVGVAINVLADRLPIGLGLWGPLTCSACGRSLPASRGIGLWRALPGQGSCPACQARLPYRHLVVETALAAGFAFLWLRYGLSADLALNSLFLAIVSLIFVVDLEHRLVLNVVVLPASGLAVLAAFVRPGLVPALIGGAIGFALLLAFHLVYPDGLGAGDVKLAGFIGLMLGWPLVLPGLFLGFAIAAVVSIALLATRRAGLKSYIPYAPFLVVGAYLALLFPFTS